MSIVAAPVESDQVRRCGYSRCGEPLRYDGRGRPPEYCAERRWPDGRTCKQMAASERAGERAVGLEVPLETFRASVDRFLPATEALARQLLDLVDAVGQVRDGAMTRIGHAEQCAGEAMEAARLAETQRDAAQRRSTEALAERDRAVVAATEADGRAAAASQAADERIAAAWARAADADHARGVAETTSAAATAAAAAAGDRCLLAERQRAEVERRAATLTEAVAVAVRRAEAAEAAAAASAVEVTRLAGDLRGIVADAEARLSAVRAEAAVATHRAEAAEVTLAAVRVDAEARMTAVRAEAEAAELRVTDLTALVRVERTRSVAASRLVDLNHVITAGMVSYPGLPGPEITPHLTRVDSRANYAEGTEFAIDRISMVGNTGTYLDSPFHRYAGAPDLADLPLTAVAGLPVVIVRVADATDRGVGLAAMPPAHDVAGAAVLLHTGWDRHWGTPAYGRPAPFLTGEAARWLVEAGVGLVGIDSVNIDDTAGRDRPAHSLLLAAGIPVLEHLTGLARVPATGARLHAAPPRVRGFGTFPVRAYVVVPAAEHNAH